MRLRSGRVYSYRYFYRHSAARVGKYNCRHKLGVTSRNTMPDTPDTKGRKPNPNPNPPNPTPPPNPNPTPTPNPNPNPPPNPPNPPNPQMPVPPNQPPPPNQPQNRFTIVTHSAIQPFCGMVNGRMPQPVESFIDSLQAHLIAKNITDDSMAYQEARSFLDFVKGDLGDWARTFSFKVCSTWSGLKTLLRKAYAAEVETDAVLFHRNIIKQTDRKGRGVVRCAAEISDKLIELADRLKSSTWVKGRDIDGEHYITVQKMIHFL